MNVRELELMEVWSDEDAAMRARSAFPFHAQAGTKSSAVVYFEIEPGEHLGHHTGGAEEILYIVDGTGKAEVGGERIEPSMREVSRSCPSSSLMPSTTPETPR